MIKDAYLLPFKIKGLKKNKDFIDRVRKISKVFSSIDKIIDRNDCADIKQLKEDYVLCLQPLGNIVVFKNEMNNSFEDLLDELKRNV